MAGCANTVGHVEIFDGDGDAMQRSAIFSRSKLLFRLFRLPQGQFCGQRDETMKFVVDRFDTFQQCSGQFDR